MKPDTVILVAVVAIAAGAFALESAGPEWARIVGIGFCLLLVAAIILGGVARYGRRRSEEEQRDDPSENAVPPEDLPQDQAEETPEG